MFTHHISALKFGLRSPGCKIPVQYHKARTVRLPFAAGTQLKPGGFAPFWGPEDMRMNLYSVLSLSSEGHLLSHREAALRSHGYTVFSTTSPIQVRFEVEMGNCGILLLCYTLPLAVHVDLSDIFMRNCPEGVVAFVMHPRRPQKSPHAHLSLLDEDFPHGLHLLESARLRNQKSA